ncbi:hypothetical protein [Nitrosospira briensis]|uniref:hypothetical protein n=1 Tax=Nitrosospira briensis TaxID=35799 RepID=UPI0008E4B224|nr:hypothetical protein [Nitrosospira briensis]SFN67220.1 hypothetical protein SAMN05216332_101144 [Nitrosospira briensis]
MIPSLSNALTDAATYIAAHNSWSKQHTDVLKMATEDDFYNFFKLEHGKALSSIVKSCLQFEGLDNDNKTIGQKARAALIRVGKENELNAIRVRRYGITTEELEKSVGPASA